MKIFSRLSFFVATFLLLTQVGHAVFSDVSSSHPNFEAINYLQETGTVEGYPDGSFRPEQEVNRAETLKIILLGSGILVPEIQEQDIFPDVLYGTWYAKYVAKAKNLGIVSGDDDTGLFRPGDTINLAEILKILLETNDVTLPTEFERRPYADVPIDSWYAPYFGYADSINLLPEDENYNVFPATLVTRGMMAQMMYDLAMRPEGYQEGEASYYGEKFHGRTTANGEIFDASGFTAAHRTLPFDTWLRVKNFENGEEVYVRINDRGPYAGDRIIDLSKAAFEAISPLSRGVINVSIAPLDGPPEGGGGPVMAEETDSEPSTEPVATGSICPEAQNRQTISVNQFENITLDAPFEDTFTDSQVLHLSGSSQSSLTEVSAFLVDASGKQYSFETKKGTDDRFALDIFFPAAGTFQLGLLPGSSGSSVIVELEILAESCLAEGQNSALQAPSDLNLGLDQGDTVVSWSLPEGHDLTKISFTQGGRTRSYVLKGQSELRPYPLHFEGWQKGSVTVDVVSAVSGDLELLDQTIEWGPKISTVFSAETHHQYAVDGGKVDILSLPDTLQAGSPVLIEVDPKVNILAKGYVILPSGLVEEVALTSPSHEPITGVGGEGIYPASVGKAALNFTPASNGLHFFEISDEGGLATVNIPVYPAGTYPLLPNLIELKGDEPYTLGTDLAALQNQMIQMVNADRATHGRQALVLDSSMSELAQSRAEDMAGRGYFSHWDPDGKTVNDLRKNYTISQLVSENLARDTSPELAQYGLMRSGSHRQNILNSEWKRAGFGFAQDGNNGIIFVQLFSDDPVDFSNVGALRTEILNALNGVRTSPLSLHSTLNTQSQNWSQKMVDEDFFDFSSTDGSSLVQNIRDAGVSATLGTFIVGNSLFEDAVSQITDNVQMKESRWTKLGIGIVQDSFGIIKITLAYIE
ncbi:MAG: septal ring lytic transglycosylase RlpA family protein [Candidatus Peregrinibacteria bacterium]|nr:septal ring lytic transglycosylase RlpA family protein [Candidatus Peregrinibacteria bacterium]